ncbi:hypothetical protein [Amycolatopsis balhimycina]|nr:hypothetical protein [Amycolatopsis balhimycina]
MNIWKASMTRMGMFVLGLGLFAGSMAATPAVASAAETATQAVKTVVRQEKATASAEIQASYICSVNFRTRYLVTWDCRVFSGAVRVWIKCSNNQTYYSGWHPVGLYYITGNCAVFGATLLDTGVESMG